MKQWLWMALTTGLAAACAGSTPTAKAPESGTDDAAQASESTDSDSADEPSGEKEKPGEEKEPESNLRTSATDILTAEETVFVLRFADSEPGKRAEETCDKRFRDNPKKYNACMNKAAEKVRGNTLTFKKDVDGTWVFTTYDKRGTSLKKLKSVKFEISEEKGNIVKLKLLSGSKGELQVEVPNDYSIAIEDPKHGKLVYEAKIGIVGVEDQ